MVLTALGKIPLKNIIGFEIGETAAVEAGVTTVLGDVNKIPSEKKIDFAMGKTATLKTGISKLMSTEVIGSLTIGKLLTGAGVITLTWMLSDLVSSQFDTDKIIKNIADALSISAAGIAFFGLGVPAAPAIIFGVGLDWLFLEGDKFSKPIADKVKEKDWGKQFQDYLIQKYGNFNNYLMSAAINIAMPELQLGGVMNKILRVKVQYDTG